MDAGRRHKMPGSEAKDFITLDTASGMRITPVTLHLPLQVPLAEAPKWILYIQSVCLTAEEH